ncbi:nuclear transport factor 2 family protein [Streptomyces sp. B21-083]|uniref:nuclear transport factor 2 family protein n=1 Tax=Streptomyces sp. B21-083 TaxID=3039410 RepID=UPI002FEE7F46
MTTDETRQLATQFIETLTTGRVDEALGLFAEDARWHLLGHAEEFSLARPYRIHEVSQLMAVLAAAVTHGHYSRIENIIADGNRAAIELHVGGKTPDNRTYDNHVAFHLDVHAGKIAYMREYVDTHHLKWIVEGTDAVEHRSSNS